MNTPTTPGTDDTTPYPETVGDCDDDTPSPGNSHPKSRTATPRKRVTATACERGTL